jgi:uncharacterized protein (DUF885 family)
MMKTKKYLLVFLMLFTVALGTLGCSAKGDAPKEDFDTFTNRIFTTEVQKDTLTLNYSLANPEKYGITAPKVTLGEYTTDYFKESLVDSENYLASLNKYDYKSLTDAQKLTYDILKEDLSLEQDSGDFILYNESLGPTTGIQAQLPVLLAEYNFYDKDDIDTYVKVINCVKDYFGQICAFEKEKSKAGLFMSDEVADSIIDQCEQFIKETKNNYLITIFNDKVSNYEGLTKEEIKNYEAANRDAILNNVIPAYQLLIDTLKSLKGTGTNDGGLCKYEKGKAYYEYLLKTNTGSNRSVAELKKMLDSSISSNMLKLNKLMTEDPDLYDEVMNLSYPLTDPNKILEYLKTAVKKDFPDCPDVKYDVKYVHKSLQEHLSPAMYLVPAIDKYDNNVIYINNNPEYDLSQIFTTIAHEGYPGHMYQTVYFRSKNSNPIRNFLNFGGYSEGWATYVEYYSYHLAGFEENVADFLEANMAANMALYCRLDIGIHYDGWSQSDTAAFLKGYGITDPDTVKLLYKTMLEEPALYPEYGIGYLEFMDLKNTAQKALGDKFVLKDFHQFILDLGPAQFDIIADRLEAWIKAQK